MNRISLFICAMMLSINVLGSPISDAVEAGKALELPTGYVQAVDQSQEIIALVQKVNAGRKAEYEKIAKRNGISVEQVGKASYQKRFGK